MEADQRQAAAEEQTQRIGRELWGQLQHNAPTIFERRWWDDRILSWAMADESVKVQMFRFVDVLPMLADHRAITRHLHEYFEEVRTHLPYAARLGLDVATPNSVMGRALAVNARSHARRMAKRFIAGTSVEEVFQTVSKLRKQGLAFTLDLLGEAVISEPEADAYFHAYAELITGLAPIVRGWDTAPVLDRTTTREIPRVNVSLKLSALTSQFRPIDPKGTAAAVAPRLRELLRLAKNHQAFLNVDMEQYAYKDLTIALFKQILAEEEFRDFADVGIVIQAYQPDAERDLAGLLEWVQQRETPIWVRLVKGAYWDYETVIAQQHGWPIPVFQQKWQSDLNFEQQTRFLMEHHQWLRPAIASHNLRSLAHAIAWAIQLEVPPPDMEIQMLYGMGEEQARLFQDRDYRVRIYTPFGELIPGMAYLVRRLLENTSNDSFLRLSFTEHVSVETLFMKPVDAGKQAQATEPPIMPAFQNEPLTDFSKTENQVAFQRALNAVATQLGNTYPLVINGEKVETESQIVSVNPSHKNQTVGTSASATAEQAQQAVTAACHAFEMWSRTPVEQRAGSLDQVAERMQRRKHELSAWIVYECGKPWGEADADVAEAIDFCRYYAEQMRQLEQPQQTDLPGEENTYSYRPRGVTVVIAPWNFPLAILTGMTTAALVAGNPVIMKPAEQAVVVAAKLMELFEEAELPIGVVQYLPGVGEEVGPVLVEHPDVNLIAFTGSRAVGLQINERAAQTSGSQRSVKKVIAEMGGKNAIIIDDDADLDEAVLGVLHSAFGYAGQKCSACSRVIVLESVAETFHKRLIEATDSLQVGPAESPGTNMGPVIDDEALNRIRDYIEVGKAEAKLAFAKETAKLSEQGFYIGPHVFTDVDPHARIAQEEIFGPVLAVLTAENMQAAIAIANDVDYALTGGCYSRSPANLERVRCEFQAGNLYLNRTISGAIVNRQPFGGYKLSGIGTKAGGPDYLREFMIPINVTENTLRRGFAPPPDDEM